jgi:hypothetical protein
MKERDNSLRQCHVSHVFKVQADGARLAEQTSAPQGGRRAACALAQRACRKWHAHRAKAAPRRYMNCRQILVWRMHSGLPSYQ